MFPDGWAISIFIVVVLFVPLCLGLTQMSHNPKFSIKDETAHFAYAHGILSQGLPKLGQHFDQFEMNEIACQGVYLPSWTFRALRISGGLGPPVREALMAPSGDAPASQAPLVARD